MIPQLAAACSFIVIYSNYENKLVKLENQRGHWKESLSLQTRFLQMQSDSSFALLLEPGDWLHVQNPGTGAQEREVFALLGCHSYAQELPQGRVKAIQGSCLPPPVLPKQEGSVWLRAPPPPLQAPLSLSKQPLPAQPNIPVAGTCQRWAEAAGRAPGCG